jgi:hypothetical protein
MLKLTYQNLAKMYKFLIVAILIGASFSMLSQGFGVEASSKAEWRKFEEGSRASPQTYFESLISGQAWEGLESLPLLQEEEESATEGMAYQDVEYQLLGTARQGETVIAFVLSNDGSFFSAGAGQKLLHGDTVKSIERGKIKIELVKKNELKELSLYKGAKDEG